MSPRLSTRTGAFFCSGRCRQACRRRLRCIIRRGGFAGRGVAVDRAQHPGDAKIGDLHPAGLVEQQVLRLDVAVNNAPVMANCRASHSGGTMASASSGVSFRARKSWRRLSPSTNSMSR